GPGGSGGRDHARKRAPRAPALRAGLHGIQGVDGPGSLARRSQVDVDIREVRVLQHKVPDLVAVEDQYPVAESCPRGKLDTLDLDRSHIQLHASTILPEARKGWRGRRGWSAR